MGSGFYLIPAHSVITLAEEFAMQIKDRRDPFFPETVLVMNFAQRVWLQRFLAEHLGICANIQFKSPEKFLESCLSEDGKNAFERNTLAWRVFKALKKMHAESSGTPPELRFDLDGKSEIDVFERAVEIGDLFWRYQSFRPQMICDWTKNAPTPSDEDAEFLHEYRRQKNLWQMLDFGEDTIPPAIAWLKFLEDEKPIAGAPPRIFAFAPSALPQIHIALLEKLSKTSEVFLYYHNLSHDLWTETSNSKKRLREHIRGTATAGRTQNVRNVDDFSYAAAGNELLTAWGKAARPLTMHLIDNGQLSSDSNRDEPPERNSLLHAMQREIRDNSPTPQKFVAEENDRSLHIAIAPNPLREMEILRDELTARFIEDPNLKPRDILVTLVDLETYAPFIQGTFENSGIPFSIADRSGTELFPSAFAFLEILRIAAGEFQIDEILSLLDLEIIRNALGLSEEEVDALRETLISAEIRWGIDTKFRHEQIFGDEIQKSEYHDSAEILVENNSWEFGLRRLALGFMCGSEEEEPFEIAGKAPPSTVPYLTEDAPNVLGKIARLIRVLAEIHRAFSEKTTQSISEWCGFLQTILVDGLLNADDNDVEVLRKTLIETSHTVPEETDCLLETLCEALKIQDWSGANVASGMLRGKVTFCKMQPMRNIPAKIICIAGLNDGAFPRSSIRSGMDLISARPAKKRFDPITLWDRSQRDDDCLLFLECILAAQETLLLSYVGRNANDGQATPPCIPLAKLRDFLLEIVSEKSDERGAPFFETLHRLHGFSSDYFSGKASTPQKFFSFNRSNYTTFLSTEAVSKTDTKSERQLPLPPVPREISVNDLALFFKSPTKFICKKSFGITWDSSSIPENADPQALFSPLDISRFHRSVLEKRIDARTRSFPAELSLEKELKAFRQQELSAGRSPALVAKGQFEEQMASKLKDLQEISSALPPMLSRVPATEIPAQVIFSEFSPVINIALDFENLYRDDHWNLYLVLSGKKEFDWRVAVELFVSAQILSAAFPRETFSVAYFLYNEKRPRLISTQSLSETKLSIQELLQFYEKEKSSLPFFFEKMPIVTDKMDEDSFFEQVKTIWENTDLDVRDLFFFGKDVHLVREEHVRKEIFPFVQRVCSAIISPT